MTTLTVLLYLVIWVPIWLTSLILGKYGYSAWLLIPLLLGGFLGNYLIFVIV
jgi:hypothetical protein